MFNLILFQYPEKIKVFNSTLFYDVGVNKCGLCIFFFRFFFFFLIKPQNLEPRISLINLIFYTGVNESSIDTENAYVCEVFRIVYTCKYTGKQVQNVRIFILSRKTQ